MTSKKKKSTAAADNGGVPHQAMLPQVNLLPAEFVEKRELGALKRKIGTAFIGFFVVLVLSYVAVHVEKAAVDRRYDQALEETARLKAEEVKYAEVPRILSQITKIEAALRDGMYREILWRDYLGAIAATVPDDGIIQTLSVTAATPNDPEPQPIDELQGPGIGQLTFSVNLKTMPDTVAWINELNAIPGFTGARFAEARYLQSPDGDTTYEFTGTVRLLEDIYSLRFEPEATKEVDDDALDS